MSIILRPAVSVLTEDLSNLLVSAFETTSDWFSDVSPFNFPDRPAGHLWYSEGQSLEMPGWGFSMLFDLESKHEGNREGTLFVETRRLAYGLEVMFRDEPDQFVTAFLSKRKDPDWFTADIFMQCLTYGKVIYG